MSLNMENSAAETAKPALPSARVNWKSVLKLLGLIIIADKKVHQAEIDTFLKGAIEIRAKIDPKIWITEGMVYDWFTLNKPALETILDSGSYDTALCEILEPILNLPYKLEVISCMVKIAISDGEYCDLEKDLIKKTCLYWNVRSDVQQNFEYLYNPDLPETYS